MTECYEQHAIDKKKLEELKYIQLEGIQPNSKNKALTKAGESLFKGFKVTSSECKKKTTTTMVHYMWDCNQLA